MTKMYQENLIDNFQQRLIAVFMYKIEDKREKSITGQWFNEYTVFFSSFLNIILNFSLMKI